MGMVTGFVGGDPRLPLIYSGAAIDDAGATGLAIAVVLSPMVQSHGITQGTVKRHQVAFGEAYQSSGLGRAET